MAGIDYSTTSTTASQGRQDVDSAHGLPVTFAVAPSGWASNNAPAAATQATITKAAGAAGVRHVCTSITATLAAGATAQTPINAYLRDGLTGAGPVLWAAAVAAPVNGVFTMDLAGLAIVGTAATAMTLEFSAAGVAASLEAVTLTGYDA